MLVIANQETISLHDRFAHTNGQFTRKGSLRLSNHLNTYTLMSHPNEHSANSLAEFNY